MTEVERDPSKLRYRVLRWNVLARRIAVAARRRGVVPDFNVLLPIIEESLLVNFVTAYRAGTNQARNHVGKYRKKSFFSRLGKRAVQSLGSGIKQVAAMVSETAIEVVEWFKRQWRKSVGIAPAAPPVIAPVEPTTEIELPAKAPMAKIYDNLHRMSQWAVIEWCQQEGITKIRWEIEQNPGTSPVCLYCARLDGKVVDIGGVFGYDRDDEPIYSPLVHEYCRCHVWPVVEGEDEW